MTYAELLSSLGVAELDANGQHAVLVHDRERGVSWSSLIQVRFPGNNVAASLVRRDPGDYGRTMFHVLAALRRGRLVTEQAMLGERSLQIPLPIACAVMRAALADIEACRPPDLEELARLHLGEAWQAPPICPAVAVGPPDYGLWVHGPDRRRVSFFARPQVVDLVPGDEDGRRPQPR